MGTSSEQNPSRPKTRAASLEIRFEEHLAKLVRAEMNAIVPVLASVRGVTEAWRKDQELVALEGDFEVTVRGKRLEAVLGGCRRKSRLR